MFEAGAFVGARATHAPEYVQSAFEMRVAVEFNSQYWNSISDLVSITICRLLHGARSSSARQIFLIFFLFFGVLSGASFPAPPELLQPNSTPQNIETAPILIDGTTLFSLRGVREQPVCFAGHLRALLCLVRRRRMDLLFSSRPNLKSQFVTSSFRIPYRSAET